MPSEHERMVAAIYEELKERQIKKLVWFGTRGADSRSLLALDHFKELFCIIAPLNALALQTEMCLEAQKGERVDLDAYTIDEDNSDEVKELHHRLYDSLAEPACLVPYRPSSFLSSIYFPRSQYVDYLGLFHELQDPFEHKPWVELELKKLGVKIIPWEYITEKDLNIVRERVQTGGYVLRSNRSDGGAGLRLLQDAEEVEASWLYQRDHFLAMAPFLWPNVPINVNAVLFENGEVSLHPPSLQIIGIPECTRRKFGYCGNDFAYIAELPDEILDKMENYVRTAGRWMRKQGYLGAFGVDALLYEGEVYITEINPRFQGSSDMSSWLDLDMDRPDMFLDHIAAFLGLEPLEHTLSLRELARQQKKLSQIIYHNIYDYPVRRNAVDPPESSAARFMLMPEPGILVHPEAILFRAVIERSVTDTGIELNDPLHQELLGLVREQPAGLPLFEPERVLEPASQL